LNVEKHNLSSDVSCSVFHAWSSWNK